MNNTLVTIEDRELSAVRGGCGAFGPGGFGFRRFGFGGFGDRGFGLGGFGGFGGFGVGDCGLGGYAVGDCGVATIYDTCPTVSVCGTGCGI